MPIAETSQRLEIGPLLQNVSGSSYRGMRTVNTYNFDDDYAFVELVQAAASNTGADSMFTVGPEVNNFYRIGVTAGNIWGQRKLGGTKTTLFSIPYNTTNHRFVRIRHTASGAVTLDTAPGTSGVPGTWTQQYSETWNSSISRTARYGPPHGRHSYSTSTVGWTETTASLPEARGRTPPATARTSAQTSMARKPPRQMLPPVIGPHPRP